VAIGDSYATLEELKAELRITDDDEDARLTRVLNSVSRGIESVTQRQFNDATLATARIYRPESKVLAVVADFHTITGLVVKTDEDDDGVCETTWTAADYELRPLNGIVSGQPGWPYWKVGAVGDRLFPDSSDRAPVEVTARWGWATVPAPVKEACLIVANETAKLNETPFGVAGFGDMGAIRVRANPMAMSKLMPYVVRPVLVA